MFTLLFISFFASQPSAFAAEGFYRIEKASLPIAQAAKSIVKISEGEGVTATGFYITKNLIFTNHHVVKKCLVRLGLDPMNAVKDRLNQVCPKYQILDPDGHVIDSEVYIQKVPKNNTPAEGIPDDAFTSFETLRKAFNKYALAFNDFALIWVNTEGIPLKFSSFDPSSLSPIFTIGFPRKIDRKYSSRERFIEDLKSESALIETKAGSLEQLDMNQKITFCKTELQQSDAWSRRGILKRAYDGDMDACKSYVQNEADLLHARITENQRIADYLSQLPQVDPRSYDMPDSAMRWSQGHVVRDVSYLDWGSNPIHSSEIDPALGILQDIDEDHGNSGGPILNEEGLVIGIVSRSATREFSYGLYGEFNYSISSDRLKDFVGEFLD